MHKGLSSYEIADLSDEEREQGFVVVDPEDPPEKLMQRTIMCDYVQQRLKWSPADFGKELMAQSRVFHCNYGLVQEIAPKHKRLHQLSIYTATWPFNTFCLAPRGAIDRIRDDSGKLTDLTFERKLLLFKKCQTNRPNTFLFLLCELVGFPSREMWNLSSFWISDSGMSDIRFALPMNKLSAADLARLETDKKDIWYLWSLFVGFCDMLRYANKEIVIRKAGPKHKVVKNGIAGTLPQSSYEIILRHQVTRYEIDRITRTGRAQRLRAHPRRHNVREHLRDLGDGKVAIVRAHIRGGIEGPGPHYNANPLAKWRAKTHAR